MPLPIVTVSNIGDDRLRQINTLATDTRIPIVLGRTDVVGRIALLDKTGNQWTASVIWCEGPADIEEVKVNGNEPSGTVTVVNYEGLLDQQPDPTIAALINGYRDNNIYVGTRFAVAFCYSVFQWRETDFNTLPSFTAVILGSSHSSNPVVCARFFLERLGYNVDEDSYQRAQRHNDEIIDESEPRREIGLVVDDTKTVKDWISTIEGYVGGRITKLGAKWYFFVERIEEIAGEIHDHDYIDGSLNVSSAVRTNVPNRVEVVYTEIQSDGTVNYEIAVAETIALQEGKELARISRVNMVGITKYSQALREASERLDKLQKAFNEYQITGVYPLLKYVINDKIEFHIDGETRLCVVTENPALGFDGSVPLSFSDFDDITYNDSVLPTPEYPHGEIVIGE